MTKLMNDIPTLQHLRDIGIEKSTNIETEQRTKIIDSSIMLNRDRPKGNNKHASRVAVLNKLHSLHKSLDDKFHEMDWIYDRGKWQPPDMSSITQIHHLQHHQQLDLQSDSGANRIVTDNIGYLHNVRWIKPLAMSGCHKDEGGITCTAIGDMYLMM